MKEKNQIDLDRFRNHKKRIPWGLIRKIIIGAATIALMFYFISEMKEVEEKKKDQPVEVEVDVEI